MSLKAVKILKIIYILIMMIFFSSCREKVFDLDDNKLEKLYFEELPEPIQKFINNNIDKIENSNEDIWYSVDSTINFTYGRSGVSDTWINEVNSNYHHFFINGVHYRLRGNKGHPFILYNNFLYYCDLNLYKNDYKKRPYYKLKIDSID